MHDNLGKTATDKVTGFTGIAVGYCQYLTGCDQFLLVPKCAEESKYPDGQWLDVNRLEFEELPALKIDTSVDNGPDLEAPKY